MSLAGDLDLVVGAYDGSLTYMENTGTTTAPVFVQRTGSANPYDGINVGSWSAPALGDIDGDGDVEIGATGRFRHAAAYCEACAAKSGWTLVQRRDAVLRKNCGQDVHGHVLVFQRS